MEVQNEQVLFALRTSTLEPLKLPRNLDDLKFLPSSYRKDLRMVEFFKFNERCNMSNFKWVLGSSDSQINVDDFEERKDIIAKLVGTDEDLANWKLFVNTRSFELYDISPYFNLEKAIDELAFLNSNSSNSLRDE